MRRSILLTALFVLTTQLSWGASAAIEEIIELLATDEKSPGGSGVQEAGTKIAQLSDSQREELIVAGLKSKKRAVRYQFAEMVNREAHSGKFLDLLTAIAEHDEDASVRDSALGRVSSIDKARALVLKRKLRGDSSAMIRRSALAGLLFSTEPNDLRAVEAALHDDHLLVRIGLTKVQAINGKPLDKNIAREGLETDVEWFRKHPLTSTGYLSRITSREDYAKYIVRIIRGDAVDILRMIGTLEDIPFLTRAADREAARKDADKAFVIRARWIAESIKFKQMLEGEQLDYLKTRARNPEDWVKGWVAEHACYVSGGIDAMRAIAEDPSHPARNYARGVNERRCVKVRTRR